MDIRLWQWMPCAKCGSRAPLRWGEAREALLSGATLLLKEIPEYACPSCGFVQRELLASAKIQEVVDSLLDKHLPETGKVTLILEWDLSTPETSVPAYGRSYQEGTVQPVVL